MDFSAIRYTDAKKAVSRVIPRMTQLRKNDAKTNFVQEKGRKKNYQQFNLKVGEWRRQERLLDTEEINSFLEVSVRASACPMPFNMDIWDGLLCPFGCVYCYANAFRASLYTAFFDNSKSMGFRHCNPDYYRREIDKMLPLREKSEEEKKNMSGIRKAFAMDIPLRLGIRFEDFLPAENENCISRNMLNYMADIEYPIMINTKSALIGREDYVEPLARNPAGGAVHVTAITTNEEVTGKLEPGAPSYSDRLEAIRNLASAGVRVVARIEPYLFMVNDDPDDIYRYCEDMKEAGVDNITFDNYSYTAQNQGIRQSFIREGFDFDRLFLAGADSQELSSLLLGRYMDIFKDYGFSCSTFDMGNVPDNDQPICCEVGDWFQGGFNYGCSVMAARYVSHRKRPVKWSDFERYVLKHGGWLSNNLREEVKRLWNLEGNVAYSHAWARGLTPVGRDEDGIIWKYEDKDERRKLLEELS